MPGGRRSHAESRGDVSRLRVLLAARACQCPRESCYRPLLDDFDDVAAFVREFAHSPKVVQDMLIMQQTEHSGRPSPRAVEVLLFGHSVSNPCFGKLMQFSRGRLAKLLRGEFWDLRRSCFRRLGPSLASRPQLHVCHLFLLQMYIRLGETLPDEYFHKYARRRRRRIAGEESEASTGDDDIANEDLDRDLQMQLLGDRSMWTRYCEAGCGTHIAKLPKRRLPPGNVKQLWEELRVSYLPTKCPSIGTFYEAWKEWKASDVLAFRGVSHFSDCDDCHRLEQDIAQSTDLVRKAAGVKEKLMHLGTIMKCRRIEESMRSSPPEDFSLPLLVLWTDGMDQAHWGIPREAGTNAPREWGKYQRPRAKVQGCWVFWWEVTFFVADHCMPHDSSMTCEVIARALERVRAIARERGTAVPPEVVIWTDNTPRENKNATVLAYLITLVGRGMFRFSALMNFPKGHSHGVLDQLFGIIARAMRTVHSLRDVPDLVAKVEAFLRRSALRQWFGEHTRVRAVWLTSVRDWRKYFQALRISYEGGMRWDATALHCAPACRKGLWGGSGLGGGGRISPPKLQRPDCVPVGGGLQHVVSFYVFH